MGNITTLNMTALDGGVIIKKVRVVRLSTTKIRS